MSSRALNGRVRPGRTLVLARHGHSVANASGVIDTALPGAELAELGRAEAKALAVALATADSPVRKACGEPVIAIVHSLAHRARDTAAIVGAELGLPVRPAEGLQEIQGGALEGRGDDEAMDAYRSVMRRWYEGTPEVAMPGGGESGTQVFDRYLPALDEALASIEHLPAGPLLVVSHSAAIRLVSWTLADYLEPSFIKANPLPNCATVLLEPDGGGWRCVRWHDVDLSDG